MSAELAVSRAPASRLAKAMALSQKPQRDTAMPVGTPGGLAGGKIGLAWHIKPDGTLWHNGATPGYVSLVAFRPAAGIGVVVLATGGIGKIDQLGFAALGALAGEQVPATLGLLPPETPVGLATLERYVGAYELRPGFVVNVSHDGAKLDAQATGQPRFRLHATSQRDFAGRVLPASITFQLDAGGKVTGFILHQGGRDQLAKRQ